MSSLPLALRLPRPTAAEKARLAELHPTHSAASIAAELGPAWTPQRVHDWSRRLGLRKVRLWTAEEDAFLQEHYPARGAAWVAEQLARARGGVRARVEELGLRHERFWSEEDKEYLRVNYSRLPTEQLVEALGRSASQIHDQAKALGVRKLAWSAEEQQLLEEAYPVQDARAIAERLGRTRVEVYSRARKTGLRRRPPLSAEAEELLWEMREEPGVVEIFADQLGLPSLVIAQTLSGLVSAGGPQRPCEPRL